MNYNRHGLSRHIPANVKAEVRRLSKFGCVRCRNAVYQYEHIDPEFADAHSHEPDAICLLCGSCHDRVTRGQLSKQTVKQAYEHVQSDAAVLPPWSEFDLSAGRQCEVAIGSSTFYAPSEIFRVNGEVILAFDRPEDSGTPPLLSGSFYNSAGEKIFEIDRNEWTLPSPMTDCVLEGRKLRISSQPNQIALEIEIFPPNKISINQLHMFKDGAVIRTIEDCIGVFLWERNHEGPGIAVSFDCWQPQVCVVVDADKTGVPFKALRIVGGQGILLEGPDIQLGAGSAKALINGMVLWPRR